MKLTEQLVAIHTRHGSMPAFCAFPDQPGTHPAIILYMDAGGFREELCNFARRIARQGYVCIVPDLYYRVGTLRFDLKRRTDALGAVVRAAMAGLGDSDVLEDTDGILAFLDGHEHVSPGAIGCVGYCMSGRYVLLAAARHPARIAAAASLYGVGLVKDDAASPHLSLEKVKGEIFFGFAENDPLTPPETVATLRAAIEQSKAAHEVEVFPDAQHGFCFPEDRRYNAVAAERVWERLFDMWRRLL